MRLTALWLSVACLHLKRGRSEKKKKAELIIAERGCDIFSRITLNRFLLLKVTVGYGVISVRALSINCTYWAFNIPA